MKRKAFLCLLAALILTAALLGIPAAAEDSDGYNVYDIAGLITDEEWAELDAAARATSEKYGCGVYIAVFEDMAEFDYSNIESFAEAVYESWELGVGEERNCILLVLSMADRDYDLMAHGEIGHSAFTDYGKEVLAGEFKDDFRYDRWADGFADYIRQCDYMLSLNEAGTPLDVPEYEPLPPRSVPERLTIASIPGLIFGLIVGAIRGGTLKRKMKSAVPARDADEYLARRGVRMDAQEDMFTHTTVVRQHIERDSGSRGSHGGTSVNSGGFSHSSGKF